MKPTAYAFNGDFFCVDCTRKAIASGVLRHARGIDTRTDENGLPFVLSYVSPQMLRSTPVYTIYTNTETDAAEQCHDCSKALETKVKAGAK